MNYFQVFDKGSSPFRFFPRKTTFFKKKHKMLADEADGFGSGGGVSPAGLRKFLSKMGWC